MQDTRRNIIEILRELGHATVDEIVNCLQDRLGRSITPVTVRHHLNVLQQDGMVTEPETRHRNTPGRPQHIYTLSPKAHDAFPTNYQHLIETLLAQLRQTMPTDGINVIFEGMAEEMAREAGILDSLPLAERLYAAVRYLNERGYSAEVEEGEQGYILHTRNCPYHHLSDRSETLCHMDLRLIAHLTGRAPQRIARISDGDNTCSYLIVAE